MVHKSFPGPSIKARAIAYVAQCYDVFPIILEEEVHNLLTWGNQHLSLFHLLVEFTSLFLIQQVIAEFSDLVLSNLPCKCCSNHYLAL